MYPAIFFLLSAFALLGWAKASELTDACDKLSPAPAPSASPKGDWLLTQGTFKAGVFRGAHASELVLENGLIRRVFRLEPNVATVALDNLSTDESVIRAVKAEGTLTLDGINYDVGGLVGQPEKAYLLPVWLDEMKAAPGAFHCVGMETGPTQAPFQWKRKRHSAELAWPPAGVSVHFTFVAPQPELSGLSLGVHYELYDGLPLLGKWITLTNATSHSVRLNSFTSEILATAEVESAVDDRPFRNWRLPALDLLSDYSFHGMDATTASQTIAWLPDPEYTSQVNYQRKMPAMLVSRPPVGPDLELAAGGSFQSFRTFLVIHDSDSRERQGLTLRRAQRLLAPWATENPIMMHVRNADSKTFREAVDQCAAVGFEMIIYTFGSGLDMENVTPAYLARIRADVDYAHARGIEVGAYSLLASRRVSDADDVINPATGRPGGAIFGNSPCLASRWGEDYFARLRTFLAETGLDLLEHDGSYPGDLCASTRHPGHLGLNDSQWKQWRSIVTFYQWCRSRGVYLNVPDYYFLAGSSKTAMGYRESNWSLPRSQQIMLGRQNIYDGTWTKAPSMGWMFVPLVEYQGGGAAATLEPLSEHLDAYEAHLANNFAAGVQACYRGPRLYDTPATKGLVQKWVSWFKQYREILESDLIHLRRPDGRDLDCVLHVNPRLKQRALAVIFNPLPHPVSRDMTVPLYYAGLTNEVLVSEEGRAATAHRLDHQARLQLPVTVPANGLTWYVCEAPAAPK